MGPTYLPMIAGAVLVCVALARAFPVLRRVATIAVVVLVAATMFAPDLAPGIRIFAAVLTGVVAPGAVQALRSASQGPGDA